LSCGEEQKVGREALRGKKDNYLGTIITIDEREGGGEKGEGNSQKQKQKKITNSA